jgi:tetratricopeptide (TPR) repeat protein
MKHVLVFVLALLVETTAYADPAEDLYNEGQAAYDHGDYATATVKWQLAYDLSRETGLLFNLAQAKRLAGDCTGAIETYKLFVTLDPASEQRPLAEELENELDGRCATQPRPITVPRSKPIDPIVIVMPKEAKVPKPSRSLQHAGIAVAGTGVLLLATGLVLGHHASTLGNEVTAACRVSCDWSKWKDDDAAGSRDANIARALDVIGGIGIASGAVMYYIGMRNTSIDVHPHEHGAAISWSGKW